LIHSMGTNKESEQAIVGNYTEMELDRRRMILSKAVSGPSFGMDQALSMMLGLAVILTRIRGAVCIKRLCDMMHFVQCGHMGLQHVKRSLDFQRWTVSSRV
ncbi:hypothetical protein GOP47_0013162, partial [Adiantum capillus-veneris]